MSSGLRTPCPPCWSTWVETWSWKPLCVLTGLGLYVHAHQMKGPRSPQPLGCVRHRSIFSAPPCKSSRDCIRWKLTKRWIQSQARSVRRESCWSRIHSRTSSISTNLSPCSFHQFHVSSPLMLSKAGLFLDIEFLYQYQGKSA